MKEKGIIVCGLIIAACFVSGFASTFSILGRAANTISCVILLVFIDLFLKRENKYTQSIDELERRNKKLEQDLELANENIDFYRKKISDLKEKTGQD